MDLPNDLPVVVAKVLAPFCVAIGHFRLARVIVGRYVEVGLVEIEQIRRAHEPHLDDKEIVVRPYEPRNRKTAHGLNVVLGQP